MNKREIQKMVLQNCKPLDLKKFSWNKKTNTFSTDENNLNINFDHLDNCNINCGYCCNIKCNNNCTINCKNECNINCNKCCNITYNSNCTVFSNKGNIKDYNNNINK